MVSIGAVSLVFSLARNVVLAASAGTGKTFHLTGALVHLLVGASDLCTDGKPVDVSRIVGTTFSRKAAGEIRERVIVHLELLASEPHRSPYTESLENAAIRKGGALDLRAIGRHARKALATIDRANITTLHALAYQIVQRHGLELGRAGELELTSEEEATLLTRDAIERATSTFADERPADADRLLTLFKGPDRLFEGVARVLSSLEESGLQASALRVPDSDVAAIETMMSEVIVAVRPLVYEPGFADDARAVAAAWDRKDMRALHESLRAMFVQRKSSKGSDAAQRFWLLRDALKGTNAERALQLIASYEGRADSTVCARALCDLTAACESAVNDAFTRARAMSFGGVLRAARDVMILHPEVAAAWGLEVDALLVDEFQDTSRLQRDLLLLLWQRDARSRAPGEMPRTDDLRSRGLLVVGDRKQSIYAFRGADVGVFTELCVGLAGEAAREMLRVPAQSVAVPLRPSADFHALRDNHRSKPELIAFANAFARARLRAASPAIDEIEFSEEAESLRVPATNDDEPYGKARAVWMRPSGVVRKTSRIEDARVVAETILDRRREGIATKWRDFAVLAHSNEMLDAAAHALAQAAVPYVVGGRGFYQAQEVRDLCSMLTALARPRDRNALLEVLRGTWAGASDRTLLGLTEPHQGIPIDLDRWGRGERSALIDETDWQAIEALRRTLARLRPSLHRLGPAAALQAAVLELGLEETLLLLPRGEQRVANVRKFLAIAEGERDTRALLRRLSWADEAARESEAAVFSEDDDAVRLLTIHASKGLDFKVVLIPEVGAEGGRPSTLPFAITNAATLTAKMIHGGRAYPPPSHTAAQAEERRRSAAERHRLLYVAITRAAEHMIFIGDGKTEGSLAHTLNELANDPSLRIVRDPFDLSAKATKAQAIPRRIDFSASLGVTSGARSLPIATTALRDFAACPRRFEWIHDRGVPEGALALDGVGGPREEGAVLHRVLETVDESSFGDPNARVAIDAIVRREAHWLDEAQRAQLTDRVTAFITGAYSKRIAGARILRELPFVIEVGDAPVVALRGTIDLLVCHENGVDVIDYKSRSTDGPAAHAAQLDAYTLAAHAMFPGCKVRAGIVALDGERAEPRFRAASDEATLKARVHEIGVELGLARVSGRFPRVTIDRCHALRCGFVPLCHAREEAPQLALF